MVSSKIGSSGVGAYQSGHHPRLLIHTGTHGDEYEVIDLVTACLTKYQSLLPSFVYVPQVSPSAVSLRRRLNRHNHDLNRIFFSNATDSEVLDNIAVLNKSNYTLFVSFHEDPLATDYYIYDTNTSAAPSSQVITHNHFLSQHHINLLNGIDDPDDPSLGSNFHQGYHKFRHKAETPDNGMITTWSLNHGRITHSLLPEIPGKQSLAKKAFIVDSFFRHLLLNNLSN